MSEQVITDVQNDKNKRDKTVLLELTKFCYENFDKRRNKEWKFSFSIWTVLAALPVICLKENISIEFSAILPWIIFGGVIVTVAELFQQTAIMRANDVDKAKSHYYEDILNETMGINYKVGDKVILAINKNENKKWMTPITHAVITALLIIIAIFVLWVNRKTETTSDKIEYGQKISYPLSNNKRLN